MNAIVIVLAALWLIVLGVVLVMLAEVSGSFSDFLAFLLPEASEQR